MSDQNTLAVIGNEDEKRLLEAFYSVPFGNSRFQIERFVLSHESPERIYRQLCLELSQKYQALKKEQFQGRRLKIELKKLEAKLQKEKDMDEKELIGIDIEEKLWNISIQDKMISDAEIEFNIYYELFLKMPKITRDQFDESEPMYWKTRLVRQAERDILQNKLGIGAGNVEALQQIGVVPHAIAIEVVKESDSILKVCEAKYDEHKALEVAKTKDAGTAK